MSVFLALWLKLFFVLTPFFGLTMFLSLTEGYEAKRRQKAALASSLVVVFVCLVLFLAGRQVFALFGITLDSFRVGAGLLLFLAGVSLVHGRAGAASADVNSDIVAVPLAIPIIVGPATTGTLLVMGAELISFPEKVTGCLALLAAVACNAVVLLAGSRLQRCMGTRGLAILSKVTGLILVAMSAQMVMTGVQNFFRPAL